MRKINLLFIITLMAGMILPASISAQTNVTKPYSCSVGIKVKGGKTAIVRAKTAEVLITPSGNLQLKAIFDLRSLIKSGYVQVKENGTTKITGTGLIVQVYSGMLPKPLPILKEKEAIEKPLEEIKDPIEKEKPLYHFYEKYVNIFVGPDGMGTVVHNWNASEMIK